MPSGIYDSRTDGLPSPARILLRVRALSVDYRSRTGDMITALRQVDLDLAEQEVIGVLGESGSGKSSLAQAIMRLLPANAQSTGGQVEFRGEDLLTHSTQKLRSVRGAAISLISQEPALALNPVLSIGRQIIDVLRAHARVSHKQAMEQAGAMLGEVGFSDPGRILRAYPHQLSGGQRQRAAIAQALICRPALLIADEPLSSLDAITQAEIIDLLQRLKRHLNLAMVFITHNAGVLSGLAERVLVLHEGEVRAAGTLDQLGREGDGYVRALIRPEQDIGQQTRPAARAVPVTKASASCEPLLQIRGLTKNFFQKRMFRREKFLVHALQDVNLDLAEGSTVAVIGRSGSGKTTLARCIAGFENADQGEVALNGLARNGNHSRVQLMFQDAGTALNPRFTAAELIREPMDIAGRLTPAGRMERALQFMEEVGLDPAWGERKAGEFSGGQRQRLALARALAAEPRLLILDESLSGLDLPLQAEMLRLLMNLQAQHGLTYLHITHDLNFLPLFADQVIVMDAGRIVEKSTPAVLLQSSHPMTRALVEASERLHVPGLEFVL